MQDIVAHTLLVLAVVMFISSLDDLVVDAMAFRLLRGAKAPELGPPLRNKSMGIFIANWHEADVLERMVEGNLAALTYRPLKLYLGVYPNDPATKEVALALERRHSESVRVIINTMCGPTSKGQLLNVMFRKVYGCQNVGPDLVVIHDSEDVIDPHSLDIYAAESERSDFIQIPVFALDSRHKSHVAAHYMEEFAERHCGEMMVRSALGGIVPSAGVGTCLTRRVIQYFINTRSAVLESGSVTEDYILGAEVHRAGFRPSFVRAMRTGGHSRFVATLEYFPKSFRASVRQKARWVHGICFEGTRKLGWAGNLRDNFFFYRDRKGAITNLLPPVALVLAVTTLVLGTAVLPEHRVEAALVAGVLTFNAAVVAVRLAIKLAAIRHVYGIFDPIGVVLRWPVAILVNYVATVRAWKSFCIDSRFASRPITWVKTLHEVPEDFGHAAPVPVSLSVQIHRPVRDDIDPASGDVGAQPLVAVTVEKEAYGTVH